MLTYLKKFYLLFFLLLLCSCTTKSVPARGDTLFKNPAQDICFPDSFLTRWEDQPAWMYAPKGVELHAYPHELANIQQSSPNGQLVKVIAVIQMVPSESQHPDAESSAENWALISRYTQELYDSLGWVQLDTLEEYFGGATQPINGPVMSSPDAMDLDSHKKLSEDPYTSGAGWVQFPDDPNADWVILTWEGGRSARILKTDLLMPVVDNRGPYSRELSWTPYIECE